MSSAPASPPATTAADLSALCAMDYRARAVKIMGLFLEEFSAAELERITDANADAFMGKMV